MLNSNVCHLASGDRRKGVVGRGGQVGIVCERVVGRCMRGVRFSRKVPKNIALSL